MVGVFFFKQKTAYEMRISDWSSDVCSSDLFAIDEGRHGDTDLSGLNIAAVFRWPGPIHEGQGECAAFVDERATEAQRNALLTIMTGGDTAPMATVFAV